MLLSDLVDAVGAGLIRRRPAAAADVDPDLAEVLLDDGATRLAPEQIVLATRPGHEDSLLERAGRAGCRAVVVPASVEVTAPDEVVVLESEVPWTQLFVLVRTMLLASHDEAGDGSGPSSLHGLADSIAVMVGGSVVLYDRAHRVVAYSVHGHEIDDVRRETILGRRTPEQWVRRFSLDKTAYQTYSDPGRVVRVADYPDLRTRLRIAVHAGTEVIGEISVAEGSHPFPAHAEEALRRAARLAVAALVRHQRAQDVERVSREGAVRSLLLDGVVRDASSSASSSAVDAGMYVLGFALDDEPGTADAADLTTERFVHFLSLHLGTLDDPLLVAPLDGIYWVIVPAASTTSERLIRLAGAAARQLEALGVAPRVALGTPAPDAAAVPAVRRVVEDLLRIGRGGSPGGQVLTPEDRWAELVLASARRGVDAQSAAPACPVDALREHDARNDSDLAGTLAVFLDELGSISSAANRMFLHPNTLRHRMQRVEEISGLDLGCADQRLAAALLLGMAAPDGRAQRRNTTET